MFGFVSRYIDDSKAHANARVLPQQTFEDRGGSLDHAVASVQLALEPAPLAPRSGFAHKLRRGNAIHLERERVPRPEHDSVRAVLASQLAFEAHRRAQRVPRRLLLAAGTTPTAVCLGRDKFDGGHLEAAQLPWLVNTAGGGGGRRIVCHARSLRPACITLNAVLALGPGGLEVPAVCVWQAWLVGGGRR